MSQMGEHYGLKSVKNDQLTNTTAMTSPKPELIANPLIPTTIQGSLDLTKQKDLFEINLTQRSSARILLTGLTDDANVRVYNQGASQPINEESKNAGNLSEVLLLKDLEPGTYFIEVSLAPDTGVANYDLEVTANTEAQLSNLWWRNSNAAMAGIWQMNGVDISSVNPYNNVGTDWSVQGIGDLNDDGEDDLIWRNQRTGDVGFWILKEELIETAQAMPAPLAWEIIGVADFDGNNRADLLWRNSRTNEVGFWLMDGTTLVSANGMSIPTGWRPLMTADFDGDAKADILWRNTISGEVGVWLMDGLNPKTGGVAGFGVGLDWHPLKIGDFNNDGNADILWRHLGNGRIGGSGQVGLWLMNGITIDHAWATGAPMSWTIAGVGDFNGDDVDDFLWSGPGREVGTWMIAEDGKSIASFGILTTLEAGFEIAGIGDFNNDQISDIAYRNSAGSSARISLLRFDKANNQVGVSSSKDYLGIGADWKLQGVLHREIGNVPFDISGRSIATGFDLGTLNDHGVYKDTVRLGVDDYFRFNVAVATKLTIQPNDGITFQLGQLQNGTVSTWQMPTAGMLLQAGEYAIKVSTASQQTTSYTLDILGVPQITNIVGTSFGITGVTQAGVTLTPSVDQSTGTNSDSNFVNVTFGIKNTGAFAVNSFKVGFRLSRNGEIETDDRIDKSLMVVREQNGSFTESQYFDIASVLAAGQSKSFSAKLKLPDTLDPYWFVDGKYYIGMELDPTNQVAEFGEPNTTDNYNTGFGRDKAELLISGTETTDLAASGIQITQGTLAPGQIITIQYTIQNLGNKPTTTDISIPIRFFLSPDPNIDRGDDWMLLTPPDAQGNFAIGDDITPGPGQSAIGGAVNGNPATVTETVTLKLPELAEFAWKEEVDGNMVFRTTPFYLGMAVNLTGSTGINEPDFENNEPGNVTEKPDLLNVRYLRFTLV